LAGESPFRPPTKLPAWSSRQSGRVTPADDLQRLVALGRAEVERRQHRITLRPGRQRSNTPALVEGVATTCADAGLSPRASAGNSLPRGQLEAQHQAQSADTDQDFRMASLKREQALFQAFTVGPRPGHQPVPFDDFQDPQRDGAAPRAWPPYVVACIPGPSRS